MRTAAEALSHGECATARSTNIRTVRGREPTEGNPANGTWLPTHTGGTRTHTSQQRALRTD
eukprot:5539518-Prymnesium_polylepis.1